MAKVGNKKMPANQINGILKKSKDWDHEENSDAMMVDDAHVATVDAVREAGVSNLVGLPQIVAVGDQSAGKSSLLEGITGFPFPRSHGLCTRYATQITCRRDDETGVEISIIPRSDSSEERKSRLRGFNRRVENVDSASLSAIFEEATNVMGLRKGRDTEQNGTVSMAFSEDVLKIEIRGPEEQHLTIIDVPGIFRTATAGQTTQSDIHLVDNMVQNYINNPRTLILCVIPCNVDIATQEVLKLAADVDPQHTRTMAVLTKPDLVTERANQEAVLDLIHGRRNQLHHGYVVVRNRGADDRSSTLAERHTQERLFFAKAPWAGLETTNRVGIKALRFRLRDILRELTRREFKHVVADIDRILREKQSAEEQLGPPRGDTDAQRGFLVDLSERFQEVARRARDKQYNGHEFFATSERMDFRLITSVQHLLEEFNAEMVKNGHEWEFTGVKPQAAKDAAEGKGSGTLSLIEELLHDLADADDFPELSDILEHLEYFPEAPGAEGLEKCIREVHDRSRGPPIGIFGDAALFDVFKQQTAKWPPLALAYTSRAILLLHRFIHHLLTKICADGRVAEQLWDLAIWPRLQPLYHRAMQQTRFLLQLEREGQLYTVAKDYMDDLRLAQSKRLEVLASPTGEPVSGSPLALMAPEGTQVSPRLIKDVFAKASANATDPIQKNSLDMAMTLLARLQLGKDNFEYECEEIHDRLESYYNVARKRFIDDLCKQVVFHYLLDAQDGPLRVFSPSLVTGMSAEELDRIAAEDPAVRGKREQLEREIGNLKLAVKALRGGGK